MPILTRSKPLDASSGSIDPGTAHEANRSHGRGHRVVNAGFVLLIALGMLAACASPGDPSSSLDSLAPSEAPSSQAAAATATPSPTAVPSVDASPEPAAAIAVDELVRTTVGNLTVRAEPSTAAEALGSLSVPDTGLVVAGPVEADGYTWYRLVSPGAVYNETCAREPMLRCSPWIGWVAGVTPIGDRWIERFDPDCAPGRDTAAYLSMDSLTRLTCAGDDEWRLVAYIAPPGGRGCFPVWLVDPGWMDPSCSFFFPQPVESEYDADTRLQGFIAPGPYACGPDGCPFEELEGSWVEVVGHLDDPVAETCTYVLNSQVGEAPSPPPDPDLLVFRCRLNLVVTEVSATAPPGS